MPTVHTKRLSSLAEIVKPSTGEAWRPLSSWARVRRAPAEVDEVHAIKTPTESQQTVNCKHLRDTDEIRQNQLICSTMRRTTARAQRKHEYGHLCVCFDKGENLESANDVRFWVKGSANKNIGT